MAQSSSKSLGRKWQWVKQRSLRLFQQSLQTNHNRILTCGCLVLLVYLPTWCVFIGGEFAHGGSTPLLNLGFIYLGLDALWRKRRHLTVIADNDADRILGYLLILGCAALFPFCLTSVSLQALLCMVILTGIGLCCWGLDSLQQNARSIMLLLIGIYPDLVFLTNTLRKTLTGNQLEALMAWLGGLALRVIGQPVTVDGALLSLSTKIEANKAVEVASGCSGFDMALVLAGVGVIMGLFFHCSRNKTIALTIAGVALALIFNVPRIMLLAFAVVYWGKDSFAFWHGPIGGQIFSTILLTVYYYAAMGIINRKTPKENG
ncbi:MAG: cyanoexosortase C [Leptolyngbya sp. BL-A-14]